VAIFSVKLIGKSAGMLSYKLRSGYCVIGDCLLNSIYAKPVKSDVIFTGVSGVIA
jgi:hypothetical protein